MRILIFSVLLVGLIGCSSSPPDRHEYLIQPPVAREVAADAAAVRLRRVEVAPYLDQDGIVLQTGASEIHAGRQHLWAEPLDAAIIRYLQAAIGGAGGVVVEVAPLTTGRPTADIAVRIHQLHGTADGRVQLVAEWTVTGADGRARLHRLESELRLADDGYPALVRAHAELLDELARAIAGTVG